jgi:4-hydroxy-tetrahydrodipicolinate synthase
MSTALDLKGIIPATILPMTADGEIDESELRKYIRWIAGQGIKAVAVNVDTGEGPHLWHDEKLRVLRIYKEELAGTKIQIVGGLGASFTAQAVTYGMDYREAGADALLIFPIPAYLGHPLPSEIPYQYHRAIADRVGLPVERTSRMTRWLASWRSLKWKRSRRRFLTPSGSARSPRLSAPHPGRLRF